MTMEWRVAKTGAEMFDALHAYGLGILVACAGQSPVELKDEVLSYKLQTVGDRLDHATKDLLDGALTLPSATNFQEDSKNDTKNDMAVANLDGLLAALFTTPGVRVVSTTDLRYKQRVHPTVTEAALKKVNSAMKRWERYVQKVSRDSQSWLHNALQDYDAFNPVTPIVGRQRKGDLAILMTLDPSFSYSTRSSNSDGVITDRTNTTLRETRYAALIAFVGAARFLRAQRVRGSLVNFYVPLPSLLELHPDTALPLLSTMDHPPNQALALQWLIYQSTAQSLNTKWVGLAYQVMQTQGAQQSISCDRGCLDSRWLAQIKRDTGNAVMGFWRWMLGNPIGQAPFEIDNLIDSLTRRRMDSWIAHLVEASTHLHNGSWEDPRPYSLREIKEVTFAMANSIGSPLSSVLEQERGTLRFGHALRLLGQQNPAPLRDIIDALDSACTSDQLVRILAQAAQECAVASAKTEFIVIPSDDDLRQLLDDVDQYGARTIAGLLIILSALRYPRRSGLNIDGEPPELLKGEDDDNE
jgi:hypothetical protein